MMACGYSFEFPIADPLIGAEQANFMRDGFTDELDEHIGLDVLDNMRDHVAFALDRPDNWDFARTDTASPAALPALILVLVLRQAATRVSSTSTMPPSLSISCMSAALIL